MTPKKLFIFVEGRDDKIFFTNVIQPMLYNKFNDFNVIEYAKCKPEYVKNYIKSIIGMHCEYIFIADINSDNCVIEKKKMLKKKYKNIDESKIYIVIKEIEGWYLAGLPDDKYEKLRIKYIPDTNNLTKTTFNNEYVKKRNRIDFLMVLLKYFDVETAKKRNKSFKYFIEKFVQPTLC